MPKDPVIAPQGKMRPRADAPPGLELDGHGNPIPLEKRTPEDQEKARAASTMSVKNPEQEAQNPAPMPRAQQGQGGSPPDSDPQGHQGGIPR